MIKKLAEGWFLFPTVLTSTQLLHSKLHTYSYFGMVFLNCLCCKLIICQNTQCTKLKLHYQKYELCPKIQFFLLWDKIYLVGESKKGPIFKMLLSCPQKKGKECPKYYYLLNGKNLQGHPSYFWSLSSFKTTLNISFFSFNFCPWLPSSFHEYMSVV